VIRVDCNRHARPRALPPPRRALAVIMASRVDLAPNPGRLRQALVKEIVTIRGRFALV